MNDVTPWTLDELFAFGKDYVAGQTKYMEDPTDDWNTYLIVTGGPYEGGDARTLVTLSLNVDDSERDELYAVTIPSMVRDTGAKLALLLIKGGGTLSSGDVDREELIVIAFDARQKRFADAAVIRDETTPPALGPWADRSDSDLSGALIEPVRLALNDNAVSD